MTWCETLPDGTSESTVQALSLPDGVPPLTTFYLYLTSGCNLHCRHCWIAPSFVEGKPSPGEYLTLDLLRKAVAEAKPLGLRSAKLTGGEPTLHPQFVEVVDFLTAEGLSLTMETNGTLIDTNLARHLKEKTNLNFVSVSLDGPNAEVHDAFRGVKGSFNSAVCGLRNLVEAGYRPQVIMSLHRGNVQHIEAVVDLVVKLGGGSIKFNPVSRSGRATTMYARDEALGPKEVFDLAHWIRGPLQSDTPIRLVLSTPLAFYTISELVDAGQQGMCHVRNILGILGSGQAALCGIGRTIPELCFGDLQSTTVGHVWVHNTVLRDLRLDLEGGYSGICQRCIHAKACSTYCVAQNYQDNDKLVSPASICATLYEQGHFPMSRLREPA